MDIRIGKLRLHSLGNMIIEKKKNALKDYPSMQIFIYSKSWTEGSRITKKAVVVLSGCADFEEVKSLLQMCSSICSLEKIVSDDSTAGLRKGRGEASDALLFPLKAEPGGGVGGGQVSNSGQWVEEHSWDSLWNTQWAELPCGGQRPHCLSLPCGATLRATCCSPPSLRLPGQNHC